MTQEYSYYVADISETWQDFPEDGDPAVIVYFEGCSHNCPGCQNPDNQKRNPDHKVSFAELISRIAIECKKWKTRNLVFSGGDPFYHQNQEDLEAMLTLISFCEDSGLKVCVYTGYEVYDITDFYTVSDYNRILIKPTYIKTGPFLQFKYVEPGQDKTGITLASTNQAFWKRTDDTGKEGYSPYSLGNRLEYPQD